jgi:iron complex transport system ATP-binding protein
MSLLQASHLQFAYGKRQVLRDVSLELAAGEVVALLGPNGAGKSTLLRVLLGQLRAQGQVIWQGKPITQWHRRDLARQIAYLPQSPVAIDDQTVADVLRLGRAPYWGPFGIESPRDMNVVREIATTVGLVDVLSSPLAELSGGQRQLVFLARCLVQEPMALLLDEPNTFLDIRHQVEVGRLLRRVAQEKQIAVLLASHDLNLSASLADRLILLHEGAVAADGAPGDVLRADLLTKVYAVEMERVEAGADDVPLIRAKWI